MAMPRSNPPMTKRNLYGLLLIPENRPAYLMAKRIGIHQERMSEYANGRRVIPDRVLLRMCRKMRRADGELATPSDILGEWKMTEWGFGAEDQQAEDEAWARMLTAPVRVDAGA